VRRVRDPCVLPAHRRDEGGAGDEGQANADIYVTLADRPDLNGKYTVFGHVVSGRDGPDRLQTGDLIRKMSLKE
jgi:cyclophilin family peptidyl-prolyl cis-trans isomerase